MDYNQFMKLMEPGGNTGKESVPALQEFIKEFPYFQTAHALLAQTMYEQQHVRYEKQLKIASAYAGDRQSLRNLVYPKPSRLFSDKASSIDSPFISGTFESDLEKENVFMEEKSTIPPQEEINQEISLSDEYEFTPTPPLFTESVLLPDDEDITEADADDGPPVADPHEIIRRRLSEILGLKENKIEPKPEAVPVLVKQIIAEEPVIINTVEKEEEKTIDDEAIKESISEEKKPDMIGQIVNESAKAIDVVDKGELEYALEASLIQSLEKLPVIKKPVDEPKNTAPEKTRLSFNDWLRIKAMEGFGNVIEVHAYDETVETHEENEEVVESGNSKKDTANRLIDRFIETEPKIVPSKVEFYSPSNQAKKSIMEDEDLVSETLASIYRKQGNLLKARSSYQKLSLLYPEKMAYFAALISDIDNELNNPDKQDL